MYDIVGEMWRGVLFILHIQKQNKQKEKTFHLFLANVVAAKCSVNKKSSKFIIYLTVSINQYLPINNTLFYHTQFQCINQTKKKKHTLTKLLNHISD